MNRQVRLLRRALADLEEIGKYIERDRPAAAKRVVTRLLDVAESLAASPERGARPRDARLRRLGFRFVVVRPYVVLYKVGRRIVYVYRVIHGRRRYQGVL